MKESNNEKHLAEITHSSSPSYQPASADVLSISNLMDSHPTMTRTQSNPEIMERQLSSERVVTNSIYQPAKYDAHRDIYDLNASAGINLQYDQKHVTKMSFLKLHRRQLGEASRAPIVHTTVRRSGLNGRSASQNQLFINQTLNNSKRSMSGYSNHQSVQRITSGGVVIQSDVLTVPTTINSPDSSTHSQNADPSLHRCHSERSTRSASSNSSHTNLPLPGVEVIPPRTVFRSRGSYIGLESQPHIYRNNSEGTLATTTTSPLSLAVHSTSKSNPKSSPSSSNSPTSPKPHRASKLGRHISSTSIMDLDGTVYLDKAPETSDVVFMSVDIASYMRQGATFIKYGRQGAPHALLFRLLPNHQGIDWRSSKKGKSTSDCIVRFEWITEFVLGQKTKVFQRYPHPELENLSISLVYERPKKWDPSMKDSYAAQCKAYGIEQKTLDIIMEDPNEFTIWTQGMKYFHAIAAKQRALESFYGHRPDMASDPLLEDLILNEETTFISSIPILTGFPSCMFIKDVETGIDAEDLVHESQNQASANFKKQLLDSHVQGKYIGPLSAAASSGATQYQSAKLAQLTANSPYKNPHHSYSMPGPTASSCPGGLGDSIPASQRFDSFRSDEMRLQDFFNEEEGRSSLPQRGESDAPSNLSIQMIEQQLAGLDGLSGYAGDYGNAGSVHSVNQSSPPNGSIYNGSIHSSDAFKTTPSLFRPVESWELHRRAQTIRVSDQSDILHPSWIKQIIALGPKTASLYPWKKAYSILESGASFHKMARISQGMNEGDQQAKNSHRRSIFKEYADDEDQTHGVFSQTSSSSSASANPGISREKSLGIEQNKDKDDSMDTLSYSAPIPILTSASEPKIVKGTGYRSKLSRTEDSMSVLPKAPPPPHSIIIVSDSEGRVFGGYATAPWTTKPDTFYGDSSSFVFSIIPDRLMNNTTNTTDQKPLTSLHENGENTIAKITSPDSHPLDENKASLDLLSPLQTGGQLDVYKFSGDDNYRYFQFTTQSGFGFGSKGLHPDDDTGSAMFIDNYLYEGTSKACPVFDSPVLSAQKDFKCYVLELWMPFK